MAIEAEIVSRTNRARVRRVAFNMEFLLRSWDEEGSLPSTLLSDKLLTEKAASRIQLFSGLFVTAPTET
jgi:hypothetical protein